MKNNKIAKFFAGKGYYIALILCAAAIGVSGYLYYRNTGTPADPADPADPDSGSISVLNPTAGLQNPTGKPTLPTQPDSTKPSATVPAPMKTASPVSGETVMDYCMDCLGYNPTTRDWRTHDGMDIAAEAGTAVCAAAAGTVYTVYDDEAMGMTVVIRHDDGYVTTYSSLDQNVAVSAGDSVKLGQTIGYVGASALLETAIGEHVHFAVTRNGKAIDPEDFLQLGQ